MRKLIILILGISSLSLLADYSEVITNSFGESKSIVIKEINVPSIIEIRDPAKVFKSININSYSNDVLMHKLSPRLQVSKLPKLDSEIKKLDLSDIFVNPIKLNYARLFKITDNIDYIDPSVDISDYITDSMNSLDISRLFTNRMKVHNLYPVYKSYEFDVMELYNVDMSVTKLDVSTIEVIVGESVYKELESLRDLSKFKRSYTKYGYASKAYLKDLDELYDYLRDQWIDKLTSNPSNDIVYIQNKTRYKIISEVRLMNNTYNSDLLKNNLKVLSNLGYDSVLVRFDCTEDLYKLSNLVDDIKSSGFNVFITYTGLDNMKPKWNPFNVYPYTLERYLSELAPKSTGFMLNWRTMSAHIRLMPNEFYHYLCKIARSANPAILIYGEIYYGHLGSLGERHSLFCNVPKNVTGVVINNMGYYGYNHKYAINELLYKSVDDYSKLDRICQVIGYVPYYNSRLNLKMNINKEYKFKSNVEKSFRKLKCSTVTLLHDGVDDNYVLDGTYDTNDNILNEDLTKWELK